jgi:quercetin 2,3-dioxygenase
MAALAENYLIHDRSHRGQTRLAWLESEHTFSFGSFQDPNRMGFRSLRVINEDRVIPGAGFPTHSHQDMEILTYVLSGALEHKDSLGTGAVIRPGEVQIMSAGTGITHSEFNPSTTDAVHFLQIWVRPDQAGLPPRYDQRNFPATEKTGKLCLIASPQGRSGSVIIHQDVELYVALLAAGQTLTYTLGADRWGWLQVAQGWVSLNGQALKNGDGVAIPAGQSLEISTEVGGEILLFDLD